MRPRPARATSGFLIPARRARVLPLPARTSTRSRKHTVSWAFGIFEKLVCYKGNGGRVPVKQKKGKMIIHQLVFLSQGGSPAVPAPLNGLGTSAIGLSAALRNPV